MVVGSSNTRGKSFTRDDFFFDTNILVYALDKTDKAKNQKCAHLVGKAMVGEIVGYVSNQVLAELYSVLTTKLGSKISREEALGIVEFLSQSEKWKKIDYDHKTVSKALRLSAKRGISIWDALISSTMIENGVKSILTENVGDFRGILGIRARNPLRGR